VLFRSNNPQQKSSRWTLKQLPGGAITIQNVHSGLYLNVEGGSEEEGAKVWQWGNPEETSSHWELHTSLLRAGQDLAAVVLPNNLCHGLYCWMVSLSSGREAHLVKDCYAKNRSIFRCHESSVFTDMPLQLLPVPSEAIGSLQETWADWGVFYNTEVFLRAWAAVIKNGRYARWAWTVKSEPDAVFLPELLSTHLRGLSGSDPLYFKDANSVVGAVEVYSAKAVATFAALGEEVCDLWSDCCASETGFMDMCMEMLHIPVRLESKLMYLATDSDPAACLNASFVAFHPFKDVRSYELCLKGASR